MFLVVCLIAAVLCWLLGLGRPTVAVAIAVDMSPKTYQGQAFNAPNTVLGQELTAVRAFLTQNFEQLKNPNEIQIFGFGDRVVPLTSSFTSDRQKLETELNQSLANPTLQFQFGSGTNLDQAIDQTTKALSNNPRRCRELLLLANGVSPVSPTVIAQALAAKVKINAIVVGADASGLQSAALVTRGISLSSDLINLQTFLLDKFFVRFNSNIKWIVLWLGGAWISLMWLLTLPLDRWVLQKMGYPINLSGQIALGNALFWTILTPIILWQIWRLFGLPFFSAC
jgi:Ca-activated chloride channel family protein